MGSYVQPMQIISQACLTSHAAQARSSPSNSSIPRYDDLPAFSVLQTDDERERKAETQRPGEFRVVVTPESFSNLPEYSNAAFPSSRRMSLRSQSSLAALSRRASPLSRTSKQHDPSTVVLDRFEDVTPNVSSPFASLPSERRPSPPESMYYLAMATSTPAPTPSLVAAASPPPHSSAAGNHLIARFRQYIVQQLCQPQIGGISPDVLLPGSTRDIFEIESQRFPPVTKTFLHPVDGGLIRVAASPRHVRDWLAEPGVRQREHAGNRHGALPLCTVRRHASWRSDFRWRLPPTFPSPDI